MPTKSGESPGPRSFGSGDDRGAKTGARVRFLVLLALALGAAAVWHQSEEEVEDPQILTIYFKTPLRTDLPVLLTLDRKEYYKGRDDILKVRVVNQGDFNVTFQGSDCSVFFERKYWRTWRIFAGAPGNYNEITAVLEPGDVCATEISISFLSPGKYRAVFLGNALLDGRMETVKAYAGFALH